jgi:glucosamine-6-phosphate deaminase
LLTGKTPEHFIKWISHLLHSWEDKKTQKLLEENGISPAQKPDMASL